MHSGRIARRLALLWLAGFDLRVTLLAVPPLLPVISRDLGLSATLVGALTTLPVLLLGLAAAVGSVVVAKLGVHRALTLGLLVAAVAGALRGVGPSVGALFGFTLLMGIGIAVAQPALPSLVRQWAPEAVGQATAVYGNGLLVAEAVAASLTLPLILPLVGSWPWALAFWSAPLVFTVALTWRSAKARPEAGSDLALTDVPAIAPSGASRSGSASRTWPNWGDRRTWILGLVQGGSSAAYFAANTFLPGYLHAIGKPGLVGITLAALNTSQLPGSFLLLPLSGRLMGRRWPIATLISVLLVATGALLVAPGSIVVVPVTVIGLTSSLVLLLSLALPAMWVPPREVASLSAGMFSVGYTLAFVLPVVGGAVADAVGSTRMTLGSALVGVTIAAAATALLPRRIRIDDKRARVASVAPTSPPSAQGPGSSD